MTSAVVATAARARIERAESVSRYLVLLLANLGALLIAWQARDSQRRHLAQLADHQLADMGLTRRDAEREVAKPFWQA